MNVYDSERMVEVFEQNGYIPTDSPENADMIVLNTCHIREKAAEKIYSELGRYKNLKKKKSNLKIGVAGCLAQAEGEEIIRRQPLVDLVVGPQTYHQLPAILKTVGNGQKSVAIDFPVENKFDYFKATRKRHHGVAAFLTVQEGCDKFCSFCVVPYTRGAEISRPVSDILAEAGEMVRHGVREITLLGQNVNAYHGVGLDGKICSLAKLIWELAKVNGLERIRYTTSHPNDMTDDLIEAHGECGKLMPYLHLPVQSGSNKILKQMNRQHTADMYMRLIQDIRKARPDILISGDFIVGFPEETEADFEDTLRLVKEVEYGQSYSFKYSARAGTPAAERDLLDEDIKNERLHRLQSLLSCQQKASQNAMVGNTVNVLFERFGRQEGQMVGKSDYLQAVHVADCDLTVGTIAPVSIVAAKTNSLTGSLNV